MADITISQDQQGAYEIALTGGTIQKVTVEPQDDHYAGSLRLVAHTGTTPIYTRTGNTVTPRDPKAVMVTAGSWVMLNDTPAYTLRRPDPVTYSIISSNDAIITVERA